MKPSAGDLVEILDVESDNLNLISLKGLICVVTEIYPNKTTYPVQLFINDQMIGFSYSEVRVVYESSY